MSINVQGDLLKKSKSGLSKEWKKKFVTLTEGKLTYYSSLQDYMHDVHGKEINLQRSTVKVPGFRPATAAAVATDGIRPIKSASSTDIQNYYHSHDFRQVDHGSVEGIGELAIAAAAMALQKSLEHDISKDDKLSSKKVWGHETEGNASPPDASTPRLLSINRRVSEVNLPVARERETDSPRRSTLPLVDKTDELDGKKREKSGSIDSVSRSSSMSRSHRDAPAVSTPGGLSTHKKGHRRRRSWGTPKMLEDGLELFSENCEFDIVSLDGRSWQFQAANQEEMESWVKAIRQQIQVSLQMGTSDKAKLHPGTHAVDRQEINGIREIEGNDFCADCNSPNPQWVSLNLGAVVCINCSGIHRKLGTHLSRIKSLELDDWSPEQLAAVKAIGNTMSRRVYEATVTGNYTRPTYTSSRLVKYDVSLLLIYTEVGCVKYL
jgi:Arf-GAP/GTPase/ANK repeat/PH domain-containing protein 1/3